MASKSKTVLSSATWSATASITSTITEPEPSSAATVVVPTVPMSTSGKHIAMRKDWIFSVCA
jgi:uncharacterized membrane protein